MVSNPNGTNFTVEVPSTHGKPHSKFKKKKIPSTIPKIRAIKLSNKSSCFFFTLSKKITNAYSNLAEI